MDNHYKVNTNALRARCSAFDWYDAKLAQDLLDAITRRDDDEIGRLLTLENSIVEKVLGRELIETIKELIGRATISPLKQSCLTRHGPRSTATPSFNTAPPHAGPKSITKES